MRDVFVGSQTSGSLLPLHSSLAVSLPLINSVGLFVDLIRSRITGLSSS